jgi:hypothetical protein
MKMEDIVVGRSYHWARDQGPCWVGRVLCKTADRLVVSWINGNQCVIPEHVLAEATT